MKISRVRVLVAVLAIMGLLMSYAQPGFAAFPAQSVVAAQDEDFATPISEEDGDVGIALVLGSLAIVLLAAFIGMRRGQRWR